MTLAATTVRATGALAVMCTVLAIATIWVMMTDPVTVATAVNQGDLSSVFSLLSHALASAFRALVRYL
ncbi:MAG TPA: hypothetical protein VGK32_18170 [Vicinamibacterales bacterium]|jgi:hypothetical protein